MKDRKLLLTKRITTLFLSPSHPHKPSLFMQLSHLLTSAVMTKAAE